MSGLLPAAALAAEVQHFDSVTVGKDGSLDVLDGDHITLIVDGVETEPVAGQSYRGDVYVAASEEFAVIQSAGGSSGGSGDPPAIKHLPLPCSVRGLVVEIHKISL